MEQPLKSITTPRSNTMVFQQFMKDYNISQDQMSQWIMSYASAGNITTAQRDQLTNDLANYEMPSASFYLAMKIFVAEGPGF